MLILFPESMIIPYENFIIPALSNMLDNKLIINNDRSIFFSTQSQCARCRGPEKARDMNLEFKKNNYIFRTCQYIDISQSDFV